MIKTNSLPASNSISQGELALSFGTGLTLCRYFMSLFGLILLPVALLNGDKKGCEDLIKGTRTKLDRYGNLSVLPRHVMQRF